MFSDQIGIKLQTSIKKVSGKSSNISEVNNKYLNNTWVKKEVTREIKRNSYKLHENKHIPWKFEGRD